MRIDVLVSIGVLGAMVAGCDSGASGDSATGVRRATGASDTRTPRSDGATDASVPSLDAGAPGDGGSEADTAAADANTAATDGAPVARVLGIEVSPLTLTPSFSPSTQDYYVRCASGQNALTLTVTDALGTQSTAVDAVQNQEIDVRDQYWIRCLPADFPVITVTAHADAGAPTPGWYLVNGSNYAAVLDNNGTPVWYANGTAPVNVTR